MALTVPSLPPANPEPRVVDPDAWSDEPVERALAELRSRAAWDDAEEALG